MLKKRHFKYFFIVIFLLVLNWGCNDDKEDYQNIARFYYPLESLTDGGKVYEFQPVINDTIRAGGTDSMLSVYYKLEYFETDTTPTLITTQFDVFCRQAAIYRDEIIKNGVLQQGLRLLEYPNISSDSAVFSDARIINPNVYPYEVRDSSGFMYRVSWEAPLDKQDRSTLTRVRIFTGMTTHIYKGVPYDAVEFLVKDKILSQHPIEGDWTYEYDKIERYAEGLGLVYYTAIGKNNKMVGYELADMYLMEDFTKKCETLFFNDY